MTADPRIAEGVKMIQRTGAHSFQLRFSDDERPVIWMAVALYEEDRFETAAAPAPLEAVMRLCSQVIDGGLCAHCHKPTAFEPEFGSTMADQLICWYMWDPELKTFRRNCEGDDR